MFSKVPGLGGGCWEDVKPSPAQLSRSFWTCWGNKTECQASVGELPVGWHLKKASWVARLMSPRRLVGFELMLETVRPLWFQTLPPASLSWHLESNVFENTHLRSIPPGWSSIGGSLLSQKVQPPSPFVSPCHSLSLDSRHSASPSGPRVLPSSLGLVHPFQPWHFLWLLSEMPFSSLSTL